MSTSVRLMPALVLVLETVTWPACTKHVRRLQSSRVQFFPQVLLETEECATFIQQVFGMQANYSSDNREVGVADWSAAASGYCITSVGSSDDGHPRAEIFYFRE